jgi:hypothetical protein
MKHVESSVLAAMKRAGVPLTRDEYIAWNWFDQPQPYTPTPEEESEMPTQFQLSTLLDDLMLTDKIQ